MTRKENRRKLIAGSAILIMLASLFVFAGSAMAGNGNKIEICHYTPPNNSNGRGNPPHEFVVISISPNAWPAHAPHGDQFWNGADCSDDPGGG